MSPGRGYHFSWYLVLLHLLDHSDYTGSDAYSEAPYLLSRQTCHRTPNIRSLVPLGCHCEQGWRSSGDWSCKDHKHVYEQSLLIFDRAECDDRTLQLNGGQHA